MGKSKISPLLCAAALLGTPLIGHAFSGITDTAGDILSTFAGSSASTDLDVVSATVLYDEDTDLYKMIATMSGPVGLTPSGFYVWGVNRGSGTAGFEANGIDGVRFDRVILVRPDGTGTVPGVGDLPAGAVTISGNTISAVVSLAMLPSTGFDDDDYTWNLWPRDGSFAGFASIADFAPDNSNFTNSPGIVPVPEPAGWALLLSGLAITGWAARRRRLPR